MPRSCFTPVPVTYTFRVRLRGWVDESGHPAEDVWREIEVAASQTLADLGEAIPLAFDFTDPHLWSFFLSGKDWDSTTEYTLLHRADILRGRQANLADRVEIQDVPFPGKTGKKEFLFLFDYGDDWHFWVKLARKRDIVEPDAVYPRVVALQGEAPPQYQWEGDDETDG